MKCTKKDIIWIIVGVVCVAAFGFDHCVKTLVAAAAVKYLWGVKE